MGIHNSQHLLYHDLLRVLLMVLSLVTTMFEFQTETGIDLASFEIRMRIYESDFS